jgi:hypothetical protein
VQERPVKNKDSAPYLGSSMENADQREAAVRTRAIWLTAVRDFQNETVRGSRR